MHCDVMTELDPALQKSGALSNEEAWGLVATAGLAAAGIMLGARTFQRESG